MDANNQSHWKHIRENGGVLYFSEILVRESGKSVVVFKRETYKKRNGKSAYIDYPFERYPLDESRINRRIRHVESDSESIFARPLTPEKYVVFHPEYKSELINKYKEYVRKEK